MTDAADQRARPIPVHLKRAPRTQVLERVAEEARGLFEAWEQALTESGNLPPGFDDVNLRIARVGMMILVVLDATPADEDAS